MSAVTEPGPTPPSDDAEPAGPARRSHVARNAAIVVGIVLVALIVLLATRGTDHSRTNPLVGQAAPEFSGQTLDGGTFRLSTYRGEWVLVNFFATWCTPCRIEHPELTEFVERHAGDPVEVVSVAFSDRADNIKSFFATEGGDWPVISSDTGRMASDYGVSQVPETFVVAPSGVVIAHFEGVTADALDQVIEQAGGMSVAGGS
jgi:cytochrome c biogenesis protein CcmG/thiol:disulfide interchange protein DsbE